MRTAFITVGVLVAAVVAFIAWRVWATYSSGRRSYARLAARIERVQTRLVAGEDPDPGELERFAQDRATRKVLYDALDHHQKLTLFPSQYQTPEALAEADLVVWLAHPNELGAVPDEMELMATLPVPAPGFEHQRYFLFRFQTKPRIGQRRRAGVRASQVPTLSTALWHLMVPGRSANSSPMTPSPQKSMCVRCTSS